MARKMTEWPSKRRPITKIMPSDGCIGDTVPLAVGKWYDFHEFGWYMGNVGQINSVNDLLRHLLAAALDLEIAHLKRVFARILVDSVVCGVPQSFSPLDLWRNQSITKFTLKVRSEIAAAGSSGVKSPKVMRTEFVRTMLPQSAVGG